MISELPRAMQEEISLNDICPTLAEVGLRNSVQLGLLRLCFCFCTWSCFTRSILLELRTDHPDTRPV